MRSKSGVFRRRYLIGGILGEKKKKHNISFYEDHTGEVVIKKLYPFIDSLKFTWEFEPDTRKIKIETISKVKDFVNEISKVDVNADLSNPDRRYIVDAKSILGILSLDISHVMNLTIYDEEKNAGKYEKIFEKFGVRDNN